MYRRERTVWVYEDIVMCERETRLGDKQFRVKKKMIDWGFTTKQVPYYVESTNFVSSGSRNKKRNVSQAKYVAQVYNICHKPF